MFGNLSSPVAYRDGAFRIQNIDLMDIAKKYGTPTYIYDLDHAVAQYQSLFKAITWPKLKIFYAMKANYNPDLLRALLKAGANIDTVSPAEVHVALKVGFPKERLLYTANNLTDEEMRQVKGLGVLLNIDSLSGLARFGELFAGSEICLRFNSDVVAGEHEKVQTGGDKTKFGIRLDEVETVVKLIRQHNLKVVGLHEHTGSGIAKAEEFCQGMKNLMSIITPDRFPDLRFIDFGGGFKVPYRPEEKRIDYIALGAEITKLFASFCKQYGRDLDLYFEPGKYIAAECGVLVVEVNTIKDNRTRLIAGTDSGFSHLIRPVLYDAYHHIVNVSNPGGHEKKYDICGNICETGDLFASDRMLPEIKEGDFLALLNAGAYGYSMGSMYNLRSMPAEVVVEGGVSRLSRPRQTAEDIAALIVDNK